MQGEVATVIVVIKHGPGDYGVIHKTRKVHLRRVRWRIGKDGSISINVDAATLFIQTEHYYFAPDEREACRRLLQGLMGHDGGGFAQQTHTA